MEIKELLSSGIIEMYCLGTVTPEEKKQVEKFAVQSADVRDEIFAVNEVLALYATVSSKPPLDSLKNKIISAITTLEINEQKLILPPLLTKKSTVQEWFKYFTDNNITEPEHYDEVHLLDLPGNEKQVTYIAWAKKGAVVEEAHEDEDEYLLMLKGNCAVTIDGKIGYYKTGDLVFIPKKSVHRAEALSDEAMLLIGQRIAA